jgi:hypothetical protein
MMGGSWWSWFTGGKMERLNFDIFFILVPEHFKENHFLSMEVVEVWDVFGVSH